MQVNNNYQPSFRAINPTKAAEMAIRTRTSAKKAEALLKELPKMCPEFDVELSTLGFESYALDAMIRDTEGNFKRYVDESIFSSLFLNPKRFINKVAEIVEKEVKPRANTIK